MQTYRLRLHLKTALGTPLVGDTLFGQLCWTLRHQHGEAKLSELLQGYCEAKPFVVVSDAFPAGYLPLPTLPSRYWSKSDADRKTLKKKRWLAVANAAHPIAEWQERAVAEGQLLDDQQAFSQQRAQPHNSIDRMTGTTGTGQFAPYQMTQTWYQPDHAFDLYVVLDESRLTLAQLQAALTMIGQTGYGRDASIGLGKFELQGEPVAQEWHASQSRHWLTLAPSAPQAQGLDGKTSYYQVQTRFGRHGDAAALGTNPFKQPLLMARTAAVFADQQAQARQWIGQGIAGVSLAHPDAVHQGYAPVIPVDLPETFA
jgi:CRISPR-associated protein Csm4